MATETTTSTLHFLRVNDMAPAELEALLVIAERMKADPGAWADTFPWQTVAFYFTKPSTRTRVSFEAAAQRLGMLPLMLRPDELQLGRGEPLADTARVLSSYAAAIVIRTFAQSDVAEVAAHSSVPVINALTDDHHPCQALADLLTLRERFGHLAGLKVAYVGDGNNVAHSLMEAGAMTGMHVAVATPDGYEPAADVTAAAQSLAAANDGFVEVFSDPYAAVKDAHAVYTDVWVSMGDDATRAERLAALAPYQVDSRLMRRAREHAIFLHCLPAHRGEEVAATVIDGPHSAVWQQAANRLPTEQALLCELIGRREPDIA